MKKICIVCPYPQGVAPSQRLKFEQYYQTFGDHGWEVHVFPFQTRRFWDIVYQKNRIIEKIIWTLFGYWNRIKLLFQLRKFDIVYIHLFVTPFGSPVLEWLYVVIAKGIVYDIDDLVYMGSTSESNQWISKLKGKQKPIFLMKRANYVVTTTPYLVDFCSKYNDRVIGIPPSLDQNLIYPMIKMESDRLVIGWSGSHSTLKYLAIAEVALRRIASKYEIDFLVFGDQDYTLDGVNVIAKSWDVSEENRIFNMIDIAIYPQEKEIWSEGKYGGKMIQYLAAGLPMVISNSNSLIPKVLKNNENAIIVDNSTEEWEVAIELLIQDVELRNKISKNARSLFLEKFSMEANKHLYLKVLSATLQSAFQK